MSEGLFHDDVVAYRTVGEVRGLVKKAETDFECLWWLWASQQAWANTDVKIKVLKILKQLLGTAPNYFTCLLASCIAYVFEWDDTACAYDARVHEFVECKTVHPCDIFETESQLTIRVDALAAIASVNDVALRELPYKNAEITRKFKRLFRDCESVKTSKKKAVYASMVLVMCAGHPSLMHKNPRFQRTCKAKIAEFAPAVVPADVRGQMSIIDKWVVPTLFQKPLDAWVNAMRFHHSKKMESE